MSLLRTENLTMQFGGLTAINGMDFQIGSGETVAIIGPNGSGKTTFFNCLTGIYTPTSGKIFFKDRDTTASSPDQNFRLGIARTFQNGRLFWGLNVLENVMMGMHASQQSFLLGAIFKSAKSREEERRSIEKAKEILSFFSTELLKQQGKLAKNLSYADRRRLEICRALAADPELLLLDEPSAGMDPLETEQLMDDIIKIKEYNPNLALITIEHDMKFVEGLANRVVCFNYGQKIAEGNFSEVSSDPLVVSAYLGEEEEESA
jgi:branched-chain amino acid transport system ATP-binding protein